MPRPLLCCLTAAVLVVTGLLVPSASAVEASTAPASPVVAASTSQAQTADDADDRPALSATLDALRKKSPKAKNKRKTLVIPVYWAGAGKDRTTKADLTRLMRRADVWSRVASSGAQGYSATVLGWHKIAAPPKSCPTWRTEELAVKRARAAAAKSGSRLSRYDRVVVYITTKACKKLTKVATEHDASTVLLSKTLDVDQFVAALSSLDGPTGRTLWCRDSRSRSVSLSKGARCTTSWGDPSSAQGSGGDVAGLSTLELAERGWLGRDALRTVPTTTKKTTRTLIAPSSTKDGTKALQVRVSKNRSYWIEYRPAVKLDNRLPSGLAGVQVRVQDKRSTKVSPRRAALLDLGLAHASSHTEAAIDAGESWTSPEGMRLTVVATTSSTAKITVSRGQRRTAPSAPTNLRVTSVDDQATLTWDATSSGGMPAMSHRVAVIHPYGIVSYHTVTPDAGRSVSVTVPISVDRGQYSFAVRTTTEMGTSPWARGATMRPTPAEPRVEILTPRAGARVTGAFAVTVVPHMNAQTRRPLTWLSLSTAKGPLLTRTTADGPLVSGEPVTFVVDPATFTRIEADGALELGITVSDTERTATTTHVVALDNWATPRLVTPSATQAWGPGTPITVTMDVPVGASWSLDDVEVLAMVHYTPRDGRTPFSDAVVMTRTGATYRFDWEDWDETRTGGKPGDVITGTLDVMVRYRDETVDALVVKIPLHEPVDHVIPPR